MMGKSSKCRICSKDIDEDKMFNHLFFRHPFKLYKVYKTMKKGDDEMSKLIIKDGKLVAADEVQNEQVIEESKQKIFKKEEAAPKPEPVQEVEEEVERIEDEYPRQPPQYIPSSNENVNYGEEYSQENGKSAYQQALEEKYRQEAAMRAEYARMKEAEMQQQMQMYNQQQQQEQTPIPTVAFYIVLNNQMKVGFNIPANEADNFYNHVEGVMSTEKLLKIENKIIPVASIAMVYFE